MFDNLFEFPILLYDGPEQEKQKALYNRDELEVIQGYAEVPYLDFVYIMDRWLPNEESLEKAKEGEFEACFVSFGMSGAYYVPWTKKKFKAKLSEFDEKYRKEHPVLEFSMSREKLLELMKEDEEREGDGK